MKKGDLIIVYKIYVGSIPPEEITDYMIKITEEFSFVNSDGIIQYFIPVSKEDEHPIEVIDTNNVQTNVLSLLENLLIEYDNIVKNYSDYESKTC